MKATRKLMALVLALVLVFSLGATAFAAAGDYLWTNGGRKLDVRISQRRIPRPMLSVTHTPRRPLLL